MEGQAQLAKGGRISQRVACPCRDRQRSSPGYIRSETVPKSSPPTMHGNGKLLRSKICARFGEQQMEKRIVFVGGIAVTSDGITNLRFRSEDSLLDGDIIVFSIDIASYYSNEFYQGMRCLDDDESFRLRNDCKHWRSELNAALTDGKTIITFVNNSPQVSVATGEKRYSGTGRNTRTTRIVVPFDPYHVIPCGFGTVIRRSGERIKMAGDLGILATYWHEFGNHTTYQGYIEDFTGTPILETQTGSKVVGGILRKPEWKGTLIFIPIPDLPSVVDLRVKEFQDKAKKRRSDLWSCSSFLQLSASIRRPEMRPNRPLLRHGHKKDALL